MIRLLPMAGLLATIACAPVPPVSAEEPMMTCNAEKGSSLVGRAATVELGAEALRLTGARTIRWLHHGDIVTMDYREDRLNVELDAGNRVRALRCG